MSAPVYEPVATRSRLDRFATGVAHFVPDAITASIVLLLILVTGALALGNSPTKIMDAYYRGLWMLLPFTMQMTLIIVLSSALGATRPLRRCAS